MEGSSQDIPLAEFISVCIYLSEECGKIIREVHESGQKDTAEKADDQGPVTMADIKIQKTLEVNLNTLYPSLTVLGEEEKAMTDKVDSTVDPKDIIKTLIT